MRAARCGHPGGLEIIVERDCRYEFINFLGCPISGVILKRKMGAMIPHLLVRGLAEGVAGSVA